MSWLSTRKDDEQQAVWISGKRDFLWWYVLKRDSLHGSCQMGKIAGVVDSSMYSSPAPSAPQYYYKCSSVV